MKTRGRGGGGDKWGRESFTLFLLYHRKLYQVLYFYKYINEILALVLLFVPNQQNTLANTLAHRILLLQQKTLFTADCVSTSIPNEPKLFCPFVDIAFSVAHSIISVSWVPGISNKLYYRTEV